LPLSWPTFRSRRRRQSECQRVEQISFLVGKLGPWAMPSPRRTRWGNRKLDKERTVCRIDGAVALAMAMGLRARDRGSAHAIDVRALIG
jgi:hypothetical protein